MQYLGQPSWGLTTGSGSVMDVLLYLRDALRLPVDPTTDPPGWETPFAPAWPRGSDRLPPSEARARQREQERADAAVAWRSWWRDRVAQEFLLNDVDLRHSPFAPAWARQLAPLATPEPTTLADLTPEAMLRRHEPLDRRWKELTARDQAQPPSFVGVTEPLLRQAAVALWSAAGQWAVERNDAWSGPAPTRDGDMRPPVHAHGVTHELLEQTAHDVAFDAGVPIERVRARLSLIEAPVAWTQVWAPGAMLCSRLAMADAATARATVYTAFRSAVAD